MKIVTWNVNGIRAAVRKGLAEKIEDLNADVLCFQETKAQDGQVEEALKAFRKTYPYLAINSAVKKGYSGTAILSKTPFEEVVYDINEEDHDAEGRVTTVRFNSFQLTNVYVPNSGSKLKRLDYRKTWDKAFKAFLHNQNKHLPLIVTGDFNVALSELDLARPKANYNKTSGYTQDEIDGLQAILGSTFVDIWRDRNPGKVKYTFWNQRFKARERNVGWRIDYFLVPQELTAKIKDVSILNEVYGSDHCPIALEIKDVPIG